MIHPNILLAFVYHSRRLRLALIYIYKTMTYTDSKKSNFAPRCCALVAGASFAIVPALAQQTECYIPDGDEEKGLIEEVAKIEKKTDKFNLFLDMHADFDASWNGSKFNEGKFRFQQLRVEARGNINSWLSYRYRQRLNKGDSPQGYRDNLLRSIDIAQVGFKLKNWEITAGKQCAAYGGIEFDLNPIEIYQYSDMVDYMDNFMTGVTVGYEPVKNHQLQFQVLNSLNIKSSEMYGDWEASKLPLVYTLNWNGNFNDVWKTRYSVSFMEETKGKHMWYFAAGNDFRITDKVDAYFDWMYSLAGVDRKGILTDIIAPLGAPKRLEHASVMSFVLHLNYRFLPKWNIFAKAMYENEGIYKSGSAMVETAAGGEAPVTYEKGRYRTAWGYIGGVEFYPLRDRNLHIFATYVGRKYNYTDRAKAFGNENYSTNSVQVGFIWHMPVF